MADLKVDAKSEIKGQFGTTVTIYEYDEKNNPYTMSNALWSLLLFGIILFVLVALGLI